jgi:hypothetical protein
MAGEELLDKAIALLKSANGSNETSAWHGAKNSLFTAYDASRQRAGHHFGGSNELVTGVRVPREPTDAMSTAGKNFLKGSDSYTAERVLAIGVWHVMLSAAEAER